MTFLQLIVIKIQTFWGWAEVIGGRHPAIQWVENVGLNTALKVLYLCFIGILLNLGIARYCFESYVNKLIAILCGMKLSISCLVL